MKTKATIDRGLAGTWVSCDEFTSSVEHYISISKGRYRVKCLDTYDGEYADVYDVKWDGERLSYCLHWNSTGRFSKNVLSRDSDDKASLTYTHTDTEILLKKQRVQNKTKRRTK